MMESLGRYLERHEFVCHHCDNRWCIELSHLYVGDASTNAKDKFARNKEHAARHSVMARNALIASNTSPDRWTPERRARQSEMMKKARARKFWNTNKERSKKDGV